MSSTPGTAPHAARCAATLPEWHPACLLTALPVRLTRHCIAMTPIKLRALHCCLQALGTVRVTRQVLQTAAASGFTAAFALAALQTMLPLAMPPGMAGASSRAGLPLALGMAALAAGAGQMLLQRLEDRFVFVDYRHSDK